MASRSRCLGRPVMISEGVFTSPKGEGWRFRRARGSAVGQRVWSVSTHFANQVLTMLSVCARNPRGEGGWHGAGVRQRGSTASSEHLASSTHSRRTLSSNRTPAPDEAAPAHRGLQSSERTTGRVRPRGGGEMKFIQTSRGLLENWSVQGQCGPVPRVACHPGGTARRCFVQPCRCPPCR